MRPRQPKLADSTRFFDGALSADVTLEQIVMRREHAGDGGDHSSGKSRRSRRHDSSSAMDDSPVGDLPDESGVTRRAMGALPTVELRAKFTNNTTSPIEFAVTDFVSPLGNFAVRPERLTLEPQQSGEIDPMPAAYSDSITELTVDVRVRHAGKTESRSLRLRPVDQTGINARLRGSVTAGLRACGVRSAIRTGRDACRYVRCRLTE
jgi:hypothetical protein